MSGSTDHRDVLGALDAFAALPEWLAAVMAPGHVEAALRRAVPEFSRPGTELTGAVVDRLRSKGDEWHVRCRVGLVVDGRPADVVLTGRLFPPGSALPPDAPAVPFGEPGWRCYLAGPRLRLEVEEEDAALPALASLVDADHAAQLLQHSLRSAGHEADVAGCLPEVVRYKPGSRCTIVYRMEYRGVPGPDPLVVKTHHGAQGRRAWEAMRALWARPIARDGVVRLAEPLAYLPEDRVLVQGPVAEECTLRDLARRALTEQSAEALAELRAVLSRTAGGLAALHRSGAEYGRAVLWEEELAGVREVVARLAASVPAIGTAADPLLGLLQAQHSATPPDPLVSAHRDFRPAQVLLHGGGIGFVDFDGACLAEPGLDLGRFCAKLRDIGISAYVASGRPLTGDPLERSLRLLDELCDGFLADYRQRAPVTSERVALWETTDLLTGVLHAWTKVRTARVAAQLTLLRHALRGRPPSALR